MAAEVVDNKAESRYEIKVDGEVAGFVTYRDDGEVVVLRHAEVDSAWEGQGLGSQLARDTLDGVRASGRQAAPLCPFIAAYIRRHPDYLDLVPEKYQSKVREDS